MAKQNIYTTGGTVQASGGLYIPRKADDDLLTLCRAGAFAYVLTSRQMGKSSLMVRTIERLTDEGIRSVKIDLTEIGVRVTAEEWYLGLLTTMADELMLEIDMGSWWQAHASLGVTQRLTRFLLEILSAEGAERVVIFVDEIDSTLSLSFTDDFFAAIRYLYNARAHVPEFHRLSFVLIGVATPSDLIRDPQLTPFNIGQRVDLTDFTYEEAMPLADGLGLPSDEARRVLRWVMNWTGGHPYLTQRLCRVIADQNRGRCLEADVDNAIASSFFGEMSEQDHNLQFVRDMLTKRPSDPGAVLATYREIRTGRRPVRDEEQSLVKSHLKLSGIVRREKAELRVRNPIYERVFDLRWVKEHWPIHWIKRIPPAVIGLIASLVLALVLLAMFARTQQQLAESRLEKARQVQYFASEQERLAQSEARARAEAELGRKEAEKAREEAVNALNAAKAEGQRADQHARIASSRALAIAAFTKLATDPERSVLYALHAVSVTSSEGESVTTEAENALHRALEAPPMSTLSGHTRGVYGIAFSPEGTRLATADWDGRARVWEAASGQALSTLSGHARGINGIAFSPNGTRLATASDDRTAMVWDAASGRKLLTLSGHTGEVYGIAFSPEGARLATASEDRTAMVWDAASGRKLLTLSNHTGEVSGIAFSPNGTRLATASWDRTAGVWNATSGQEQFMLSGHTAEVYGIAFSPKGTRLATASADKNGRLYVLDIKDLMALARRRVTRSLTTEECQLYLRKEECPPTP